MFLLNDKCEKERRDTYDWTAFEIAFYNLRDSVVSFMNDYDLDNETDYAEISWKAWVRKFSVSNYIVWLVAFNIFVPLMVLLLIMYNSKKWQDPKELELQTI